MWKIKKIQFFSSFPSNSYLLLEIAMPKPIQFGNLIDMTAVIPIVIENKRELNEEIWSQSHIQTLPNHISPNRLFQKYFECRLLFLYGIWMLPWFVSRRRRRRRPRSCC